MKLVEKTFVVNGRRHKRKVWEYDYPERFHDLEDGRGEEDSVACIKRELLTPEQETRLRELGLDIADLLNGRYPVAMGTRFTGSSFALGTPSSGISASPRIQSARPCWRQSRRT